MDPCLTFCNLLKRASCLSEKRLSDSLRGMEINLSQAMLLVHLRDGEMSMSRLGSALCCHKSNVTQLVDSLKKKGLVERCEAHADRRVQCVKLSQKGKNVMRDVQSILEKNAHGCTAVLGQADAQRLMKILTLYVERQAEKV